MRDKAGWSVTTIPGLCESSLLREKIAHFTLICVLWVQLSLLGRRGAAAAHTRPRLSHCQLPPPPIRHHTEHCLDPRALLAVWEKQELSWCVYFFMIFWGRGLFFFRWVCGKISYKYVFHCFRFGTGTVYITFSYFFLLFTWRAEILRVKIWRETGGESCFYND